MFVKLNYTCPSSSITKDINLPFKCWSQMLSFLSAGVEGSYKENKGLDLGEDQP